MNVLPGFRLRPSLSAFLIHLGFIFLRVLPGFRLRPSLSESKPECQTEEIWLVLPGFRLRPSLSEDLPSRTRPSMQVLPGFRLRPSLSASTAFERASSDQSVAGVSTPAFVER